MVLGRRQKNEATSYPASPQSCLGHSLYPAGTKESPRRKSL